MRECLLLAADRLSISGTAGAQWSGLAPLLFPPILLPLTLVYPPRSFPPANRFDEDAADDGLTAFLSPDSESESDALLPLDVVSDDANGEGVEDVGLTALLTPDSVSSRDSEDGANTDGGCVHLPSDEDLERRLADLGPVSSDCPTPTLDPAVFARCVLDDFGLPAVTPFNPLLSPDVATNDDLEKLGLHADDVEFELDDFGLPPIGMLNCLRHQRRHLASLSSLRPKAQAQDNTLAELDALMSV